MRAEFECHQETVLITPAIAIGAVYCDDCDDVHGYYLSVGWMIWTFSVVVEAGAPPGN